MTRTAVILTTVFLLSSLGLGFVFISKHNNDQKIEQLAKYQAVLRSDYDRSQERLREYQRMDGEISDEISSLYSRYNSLKDGGLHRDCLTLIEKALELDLTPNYGCYSGGFDLLIEDWKKLRAEVAKKNLAEAELSLRSLEAMQAVEFDIYRGKYASEKSFW